MRCFWDVGILEGLISSYYTIINMSNCYIIVNIRISRTYWQVDKYVYLFIIRSSSVDDNLKNVPNHGVWVRVKISAVEKQSKYLM